MELGPVEVPRQIARALGVEARRRQDRREALLRLVVVVHHDPVRRRRLRRRPRRVRGLERVDRPVFLAQERAIEADRVGVVVLIVGAVAEVERALVVDLHHHDRPLGMEQRAQRGGQELEIAGGFVEERLARVARHGEREGQHRQHHRVALGGARLAIHVPDDALGDAEEGELGVDVRAGPGDHVEAELVREADERAHVALRIALPELELPGRDFVDIPGDVHVDQPHAEGPRGLEASAPIVRIEAPVVHAPRDQRDGLVADEQPAGAEAHAPPFIAFRSLFAQWFRHDWAGP